MIEKYITLILKSIPINFDRIVVTGTRAQRHIKDSPVLTHVISKEDIENSPYATAKEVLELIMPNVQTVASNHTSDRVKIQGLDNKEK